MIEKLYYIHAPGLIPYANQALEEYLLRRVRPGELILYLWQNKRTVVIGRNQNCWQECRVEQLIREGGFPARRLSGGGAVFHDSGNLNFTFCLREEDYNLDRQLAVIGGALAMAGIETEKSGRNDILVAGRKFSGNAFYKSGKQCFHHGTIMVDVDLEELGRYLNPSADKLAAKGVASVRSRVANLKEFAPELTIDTLRRLLTDSLGEIYGGGASLLELSAAEKKEVETLAKNYSDWNWIFGKQADFDIVLQNRFAWGGVCFNLAVLEGEIAEAIIYSDALEAELIVDIGEAVRHCRYESQELLERISGVTAENEREKQIVTDICQWLGQEIA
jgi:lipoate---protein ligase